jgi:hypothetical protein
MRGRISDPLVAMRHTPTPPRLFFVVAACNAVLAAQSFVVDVNGGPGANFTSLTAAVAAVPDGSILRVRAGDYVESVVVAAKGLTISGDTGAAIVAPAGMPALHVVGLAATQVFVIRGMGVRGPAGVAGEVRLQANQGLVFLDAEGASLQARLHATACDALLVSSSNWYDAMLPGATIDSCRAVFDQVTVMDLQQIGGDVQLAGSTMYGRANFVGVAGPAVTMQGGDLRLLGSQVQGGSSWFAPGLAIAGTGSVRRTPGTQLQGASPPTAPGIGLVTAAMPHVATNWITSTLYSVYASGAIGDLAFLVGSVRALPLVLPGVGDVWLDAATARVETAGVFTGGAFAAWVSLPTSPAFTGLSLVWQVVSFAPNGSLSISNPTWRVLP